GAAPRPAGPGGTRAGRGAAPRQVRAPGEAPLRALHGFLRDRLAGLVSAVHLLPVFPWSSDDGYAVEDFASIDPALGDWDDVAAIARDFDVMLDVVMNHVSASHPWLTGFLGGDPAFGRHFLEVEPGTDLSGVVRPRTTPLLTPFPSSAGERLLWTTFSADQVDLNYAEPAVLARMLEVVLDILGSGATLLRLDAVGYTWKEPGTSCLNLAGAHHLVRAVRSAVDAAAPGAAVVTETNVPQPDNVAYFGDGAAEAHAVYQFSLPPLVLHALMFGTAERLSPWISELEPAPPGCAYLDILATHDGIGLMPAHGILPEAEIAEMVERVRRHGGLVTMRDTPFGPRPYELNSTLFDALSDPNAGEPESLGIDRHLAASSIMLALAGVPGIYVHSLFGTPNDREAANASGIPRRINRRRFERAALETELGDPRSRARRVFDGTVRLLRARGSHPAFRPDSPQRVLEAPSGVLALERGSDATGRVRCLVNLTTDEQTVPAPEGIDLLAGRSVAAEDVFRLGPYEVAWIAEDRRPQPPG
ncbi:MAG TPA: alpha-amylase family glycosyl hydrolase, partial [Actinomycetota bacterium]|nr:alpha-amylase family glycosyl hydrolase [Actinomycetota bacterium]